MSTSIIGFAALDRSLRLVGSEFLSLKDEGSLIDKADLVKGWVEELEGRYHDSVGCEYHFIEDRLAGFTRGFSNANTKMKLGAFNELVTWIIWDYWPLGDKGKSVQKIHPTTVKSLMKKEGLLIPKGSDKKKELTLEFVRKRESSFVVTLNRNDNPRPENYDRADAYITGLAGARKYRLDAQ